MATRSAHPLSCVSLCHILLDHVDPYLIMLKPYCISLRHILFALRSNSATNTFSNETLNETYLPMQQFNATLRQYNFEQNTSCNEQFQYNSSNATSLQYNFEWNLFCNEQFQYNSSNATSLQYNFEWNLFCNATIPIQHFQCNNSMQHYFNTTLNRTHPAMNNSNTTVPMQHHFNTTLNETYLAMQQFQYNTSNVTIQMQDYLNTTFHIGLCRPARK